VFTQEARALWQKHEVGPCFLHIGDFSAGHAEEVDVHAHERLIHDMQTGFGQ
jgi:hypothetical protein